MQIEYLAEFVDLAETLSYQETARRCLVSESALSRHIKGLEADLGVTLFRRTSRRVRLSPDGALLLPHARAISAQWLSYRQQAQQAGSRITIAGNYYVSDLIASFCAQEPGVSVVEIAGGTPTDQLLPVLSRGDCQFAVLADPPELDNRYGWLLLAEDRYVAVLPVDHPLSGKPAISPSDLAGEQFISLGLDTDGDRRIKQICRSAGFEPNVTFSAAVGSSVARFVRDGSGVSFLHKGTITKMDPEGVVLVELSPPAEVSAVLCWDRTVPMSAAAQLFLSFARRRAGIR